MIGAHSSMQGPFLFHAGEDAVMRPKEVGQIVGPSSEPVGVDGSTTAPGVPVEGGGSTVAPHELIGVDRSTTASEVLIERGGSTTIPSEARVMGPSTWEQGTGSKRSSPDELEQESGGSSPKRPYHPTTPA